LPALHHAILAEFGIYSYLNSLDEVKVYAEDGPGSISVTSDMSDSVFEELFPHVQATMELASSQTEREVSNRKQIFPDDVDPNGLLPVIQDAAVISSVLHCFSAKYEQAEQALADVEWPPVNENNGPLVLEGYRFVLAVQAWVIKGGCWQE
jgi:hypothetical protein